MGLANLRVENAGLLPLELRGCCFDCGAKANFEWIKMLRQKILYYKEKQSGGLRARLFCFYQDILFRK